MSLMNMAMVLNFELVSDIKGSENLY